MRLVVLALAGAFALGIPSVVSAQACPDDSSTVNPDGTTTCDPGPAVVEIYDDDADTVSKEETGEAEVLTKDIALFNQAGDGVYQSENLNRLRFNKNFWQSAFFVTAGAAGTGNVYSKYAKGARAVVFWGRFGAVGGVAGVGIGATAFYWTQQHLKEQKDCEAAVAATETTADDRDCD